MNRPSFPPAHLAGSTRCDHCGAEMTPENARYVLAADGMGWPSVVFALHEQCGGGLTAAEALAEIDAGTTRQEEE